MENIQDNNTIRETDINYFRKYFSKLLAGWYWIALSLAIAFSIATIYTKNAPSKYQVETTLILNNIKAVDPIAEKLGSGVGFKQPSSIQNEMVILRSNAMIKKVVEAMDLNFLFYEEAKFRLEPKLRYADFPINGIDLSGKKYNRSILFRIVDDNTYEILQLGNTDKQYKVQFGERFQKEGFDFILNRNNSVDNYLNRELICSFTSTNQLINLFKSGLSIRVEGDKTSILKISVRGQSPKLLSDFLNKLCEVYIAYDLDQKHQIDKNTIAFIDTQLAVIDDSLNTAEKELLNFQMKNNFLDLSTESKRLLDQMSGLQQEKSKIALQKQFYYYLQENIDNNDSIHNMISPGLMGVNDGLIDGYFARINTLIQQKNRLIKSTGNEHPSLHEIDYDIQLARVSLKKQIDANIKNIQVWDKKIDQQISQLDYELRDLPMIERKYLNIEQKYDISNNIYNYLLQRRTEAAIKKASSVSDKKILDMADYSNYYQIAPNKRNNYLRAFILGLLLPILGILGVYLIQNRITDLSDIASLTNLSLLATISHGSKKSELNVLNNPSTPLAESFRALRTNLQYLQPNRKPSIIAVTSAISGEGKTFTAINLASAYALAGKRTLLIGMDLRRPRLHRVFDVSNEFGVSSYLYLNTPIEDLYIETQYKNLFLTVSGPVPPNPVELLESKQLEHFFNSAKVNFDIVIVDTPPVAIVADSLLITKYADETLFILRQNYTKKTVISLINDLRSKNQLTNINLVVNDLREKDSYGYGYYHNYYSSYYNNENNSKFSKLLKI